MWLHLFLAFCVGLISWAVFGHFWAGCIGACGWFMLTWGLKKAGVLPPKKTDAPKN